MKRALLCCVLVLTSASPARADASPLQTSYADLQSGRYKQAAKTLFQLVQQQPNNATARRYLAWAVSNLGRPELAFQLLKSAQSIDGPKELDASIEFAAQLAMARKYVAAGQTENANRVVRDLKSRKLTPTQMTQLDAVNKEVENNAAPPPPSQSNLQG
jgi:thioredoxin-like negative regulator of GroEL